MRGYDLSGRVRAGSTFSSGAFFCEQWGCDLSAWTLSDCFIAFTLCHCVQLRGQCSVWLQSCFSILAVLQTVTGVCGFWTQCSLGYSPGTTLELSVNFVL